MAKLRVSKGDLLEEATQAIEELVEQRKSRAISSASFNKRLRAILDASESLTDTQKGLLKLRSDRGAQISKAPSLSGNPLATIQRPQAGIPQFIEQAQTQASLQAGQQAEAARRGAGTALATIPQGVGPQPGTAEQILRTVQAQAEAEQIQQTKRAGIRETRVGNVAAGRLRQSEALLSALGGQTRLNAFGGSSPVTVDPQAIQQIATPQGSTIAARKASVSQATEQAVRGVRGQKTSGGIGRGIAGLGGGILASIIAAKLFGGGKESQNIDPSVQLALAQQLGGGGGQGGGLAASSRALIDVSRLVTILKGIQQLGNLQGPVAQSGGRLI